MKKFIILGIAISLLSCNNETGSSKEITGETIHGNAKDTIVTTPVIIAGCYMMAFKQDTARLQLSIKDTIVTGELNYKWHAKDNNTGTFKGVLRDSLIFADYTFQSEGMVSVREVIFKIGPGKLQQAYGEMDEKNNMQVFKNRGELKYDSNLVFSKTLCR
ncbi:MAG TPA: hypothetical protein VMY77_09600 [Chitinophagaceae bacterium]|nr:hypothetical protein [Chitinophagaceae bacterium]